MTTTTIPDPRHAALTARDQCQASIGWRTELVDGFPKERVDLCENVVGVRGFTDVDGRRRTYCAIPGHEGSVRRRFPALMYGSADGPVFAGDFGPSPLSPDATSRLIADTAHWGQSPEHVR